MTLEERNHLLDLTRVHTNLICFLETAQSLEDEDVWTGTARLHTNSPVFAEFEAFEGNGLELQRIG